VTECVGDLEVGQLSIRTFGIDEEATVTLMPFDSNTAPSKSPRTVSAVATSIARSWSEPSQLSKAAS
jgi:hypothetical protein